MGCDIHCAWEYKRPDQMEGLPGKWVSLDEWGDPWGDDEGIQSPKDEIVSWRNYGMFAVMANVRNGYGFAGVDTGDELQPIAMPRGCPADADYRIIQWVKDWAPDGHSHSYLTLKDILDYDQTRTVKARGVVGMKTYHNWCRWRRDEGKGPSGHSGGVWGPNVRTLTPDEADAELDALRRTIDPELSRPGHELERLVEQKLEAKGCYLGDHRASDTYVAIEWTETYGQQMGQLWSEAVPKMLKVCRDRRVSSDDVRLVFFFDN